MDGDSRKSGTNRFGCVPAGPGLCHPTGAEAVALRRELAPSFQPSPATNGFLVDFNGI